ncbi:MAG: nitrite reductase large subunit NirB, partial [Conexibacter sp.]
MSGILVIGGGIAGQSVCERVRERDPRVPVALLCKEPELPYDRVALSHLLAGETTRTELQLRPEAWYADHDVDVRLGAAAAALDLDGGVCTLDDGGDLAFERVVLCTGSDPLLPPLGGIDLPGVLAFRDPSDCDAIAARARTARQAVVIGGGLLGLEAARGIAGLGCPVTVVHLVERLMERQLDEGAAALLLDAMRELDVDVRLETQTTALVGEEAVSGLLLADGSLLPADLVVVSIGIRPQVALARATGLEVERGIVVDDAMVTSHPRALAVGECAQHRGVVYGLVAPIHEQAAVAAQTLTAGEAAYAGSVQSAKLKVMGVDLVAVGDASGAREVVAADAATRTYRKLVVDGEGRAAGAVLLGDTRGHELLLEQVRRREPVEDLLGLLQQASEASAADLPDTAQVCNCNGVCKGEIVGAIRAQGLGSTQEVVAVTRAGSGCGSCKPLVRELLAIERGGADEEPAYLCPCRKQTREQLAALVRERELESVSELTATCGAGHDCGACKPGLAYLVSQVQENRHREERHARFINDRVHANIQNDGTFSVVPRIRGGVTTPDELRRIADVADKYQIPMVKVTGGQRIDLLGVKKEDLVGVWKDLGMQSGHAYGKSIRTVKTCVGSEFCRFGTQNSTQMGIDLETMLANMWSPHKVKLAVSGCPRNCAEAGIKDVGVIAVDSGWEIYVGGNGGIKTEVAQFLAKVKTADEVKEFSGAFLQLYRE